MKGGGIILYLGNVRALDTDGVATHSSSAFPPQETAAHSFRCSGQKPGALLVSLTCTLLLGKSVTCAFRGRLEPGHFSLPPSSPAQLMSLTVTTALAFDAFDPFDRDAWLCRPPPPVINRAARGSRLLHKIRPRHLSAQGLLLASPPEQKAKPQVTCEDTHGARSHSPWLLITRAAHSPSCP